MVRRPFIMKLLYRTENDSTVYPPAGWTRLPPSVAPNIRALLPLLSAKAAVLHDAVLSCLNRLCLGLEPAIENWGGQDTLRGHREGGYCPGKAVTANRWGHRE